MRKAQRLVDQIQRYLPGRPRRSIFYVQGIQAVELRNWIRILVMAHVQPISAEIQLLDAPSSDPEDSCKVI